ncbi:SDR family oxidoreductase [Mycetocola zhadangensis]|uniref:SDR family oxidoreductase n=1 Tax=Mycetocola zhadangensis TaxID=1164595 RepID=UPI003A4DFD02
MRIVIIGGTGLIGRRVGEILRESGHEVVAASRSTGVNVVTGEGLDEVLRGAHVVVDVPNSPSFDDGPVMEFFRSSTQNLVAAGKNAGVRHHVVLSIVGTDRLPGIGYMRAKTRQEEIVRASGIPHTIVRATQFFEFISALADGATDGDVVRLAPVLMQPIAAADVSSALARIAIEDAANEVVELAGPEAVRLAEVAAELLQATGDARRVVPDMAVGYFGGAVTDESLTPGHDDRVDRQLRGTTTFSDWLNSTVRR